jgi:urease accessory protein
MLRLEGIVGNERDAVLSGKLHKLRHEGKVEYLFVQETDIGRRRLRLSTDRGTDCGISLSRNEVLEDGAVLFLEDERAVVTRVGAAQTLRLRPRSSEGALRLGWNAGNLHWKVKFDSGDLVVLVDGTREEYLARLATLISEGLVEAVDVPVDP